MGHIDFLESLLKRDDAGSKSSIIKTINFMHVTFHIHSNWKNWSQMKSVWKLRNMADARATTCYLNGLSLRTINEVEKVFDLLHSVIPNTYIQILRSLPREGDPCEIQCSQPSTGGSVGRSTADVIVSKVIKYNYSIQLKIITVSENPRRSETICSFSTN